MLETVVFDLGEGKQIPLLQFHSLKAFSWIEHCFTTRQGGVSKGVYQSLNLSFTRGDEEGCVRENFRRVAEAMGTAPECIVTSQQTHTTNIRRVRKGDAGKGVVYPMDYQDVDGLITDEPGLLLATFYADCVPLYFVDPEHHAIGLSHSGWRGTLEGMGEKTVMQMKKQFDTNPEKLYCAIGPSICQNCYEISEDVAFLFADAYKKEADDILKKCGTDKYKLDLWRANELVLKHAGVKKEHIDTAALCTCCHPNQLFSHRATGGKRGNLGAFLMIRPQKEA